VTDCNRVPVEGLGRGFINEQQKSAHEEITDWNGYCLECGTYVPTNMNHCRKCFEDEFGDE
jgi:ribosomal protein L40E